MNRHSNYSPARFIGTLTVILMGSLAFTPTVFATKTSKESPFCSNLPTTISKVNTSLTNLQEKMTTARNKQNQDIASDRMQWDQELQADRARADKLRQDNFTKLEAKAKTNTQLAAVKTYEAAITAALTARRTADDAARTTYRSGVDSAIAAQRSTIDQQVTTYVNAVNAAEAAAQASCQATPNEGPSIRPTFQAALKSARETYVSDRKSDGTIASQVKQLAQTRDASLNANETTFLNSVQVARTALKAVFGSTNI